jgi:hypothetical protein
MYNMTNDDCKLLAVWGRLHLPTVESRVGNFTYEKLVGLSRRLITIFIPALWTNWLRTVLERVQG